ncbi:MAG TPA: GNAT family N-acetyltransferase [Verrucomicrobiota bacterium]|nr:GNAT family N-acetyltransferase [Verrucomicrobiota bacterium]
MSDVPAFRLLEWDSGFFGCRIGRVAEVSLTPELIEKIERWVRDERIDCVYYLADAADAGSIHLAEAADFRLMDIRVTLLHRTNPSGISPRLFSEETGICGRARLPGAPSEERPAQRSCPTQFNASRQDREPHEALHQSAAKVKVTVRSADVIDLPPLQGMARVNHRDTRFYQDPHFSRERSDELYATWMARSFEGFADQVIVIESQGRIAGYITVSRLPSGRGQIGLCGVDSAARGLGIGRILVQSAQAWFAEQNLAESTVVTQGRNIAALRLYQKCGYAIHQIQLWFHRWSN